MCVECRAKKKCEHGKQKYYCKICGNGKGYCVHGYALCTPKSLCYYSFRFNKCISREKRTCVDCGGKAMCIHGRKECGTTKICAHHKFKWTCRECGKSFFCVHGRIKYSCSECKTSGGGESTTKKRAPKTVTLCAHGISSAKPCRDCLGLCIHWTHPKFCRDCKKKK